MPLHKKIALIQMSCASDTQDNLKKAASFIRDAAHAGAHIVCLPELFRAQYFCQREDHALFDLAEPIPGPSTELLSTVAREEKIVLIASLFERRAPGLYHNTAAVLESDGTLAGLYRKMHIPDDPLYYEKFYFTPGDLGFRAFSTSHGKHRNPRLLGPVVPRSRAHDLPHGRRNPLLPHRHRLAPQRESRIRRSTVQCLADHAARPRHR